MEENIKNYLETIDLLRKEIKSKDKDIHLAATFGSQLLAEKDEIALKLQQMQAQVEDLEQEKYSLQQELEVKSKYVGVQNQELEMQIDQIDCLNTKVNSLEKEMSVLKQRCCNLLKEKCEFERLHVDLQLQYSSSINKIQHLEQQVKRLQDAIVIPINESQGEEVYPDVNLYINKNKQLEAALVSLQDELDSSKLKESRLSNLIKELEEAVEDRDRELSSYSVEIQKEKAFSAELQCEIEQLKLEEVDVDRRGNSMFAELDDRRKLVENEFKLLSKKYKNVLQNYEENKKELIRCKGQMAILLSMTSKKYQDTYIDTLQKMLADARRENKTLSLKLENAIKRQQQQSMAQIPSKKDQYDYLRIMNQQAQEKIKLLEENSITARMQIINLEKNLLGTSQDLYKSRSNLNKLEIENMKLQQEIKELTFNPTTDVPTKPQPKIEILPGFESKCENKTSETTDGQNNTKVDDDIIPGELMLGEEGFKEIKPPRLTNKSIIRNALQREGAKSDRQANRLKEINRKFEQTQIRPDCENVSELTTTKQKGDNCAQQ